MDMNPYLTLNFSNDSTSFFGRNAYHTSHTSGGDSIQPILLHLIYSARAILLLSFSSDFRVVALLLALFLNPTVTCVFGSLGRTRYLSDGSMSARR